MNPDQLNAFNAHGGFTPSSCATLLLSAAFVALLVWGTWALRSAYVGWAEQQIPQRQFLSVLLRFVCVYLVLSFLLLN